MKCAIIGAQILIVHGPVEHRKKEKTPVSLSKVLSRFSSLNRLFNILQSRHT